MTSFKLIHGCLILLLISFEVGAQDQPPSSSNTDKTPLAKTDAAPKDWLTTDQESDWNSATYEDLVDWANQLGLDSNGTAAELRSRIGAKLGFNNKNANASKKIITIESAQQAQYLDIKRPEGGKTLWLTGGVKVTMSDNEKNIKHTIESAELFYDQKQGEMTAKGGVVYTMDKGSSKDIFKGESLTFRMSDSDGVFYQGEGSTTKSVDSTTTLVFRFKGDKMHRSGDDVIVMNDATVTSSPEDPPNYALKASKIWILGPGEWGIQNMVLNVGRIPLFYFPFFFQPGDDFIFNPVLGFNDSSDDTRGTYLQTTTYFIGKKTKTSNAMSFMQLSGESDTDRVWRGLYQVPGKPTITFPSDWYLKYTADFYSNLGFITTLQANLPKLGDFSTLTGDIDLGFTRTVYSDGTPYSFDAAKDPLNESSWNNSYIGHFRLPFRWGVKTTATYKYFQWAFEYATDPTLSGEAYENRAEDFTVFNLLKLSSASSYTAPTAESSLTWSFSGTSSALTWKTPFLLLSSISITTLSATAEWDTQTISSSSDTYDPTNSYYSPYSLVAPSIALSLSGQFFSFGTSDTSKNASASKATSTLIPPWPEDQNENKPIDKKDNTPSNGVAGQSPNNSSSVLETAPDHGPIPPNLQGALTLDAFKTPGGSSGNLSWTYVPTYKVETFYDETKWTSPEEADLYVKSSRWYATQEAKLIYSQSANDNLWNGTETLTFKQAAQQAYRLEDSMSQTTKDTYYLTDAEASYVKLYQSLVFTVNPLINIDAFKSSNVVYSLTSRLWNHVYSYWNSTEDRAVFKDEFWDGTPDSVSTHEQTSNFIWDIVKGEPALKFTGTWYSTITPRPTDYKTTGLINSTWGWFTLSTSVDAVNTGSYWVADLWSSSIVFSPWTNLSLTEAYIYDIGEKQNQSWISTFAFWGFTTKYTVQQTTPYSFSATSKSWVAGDDEKYLPSELDFSYSSTWTSPRFWDGRAEAGFKINSSWDINLQEYTSMPLTIGYTATLKVYKFLDFSVTHSITNKLMYMYFPRILNILGQGVEPRNFWNDLGESLIWWNTTTQYDNPYKMQAISLSLIHYLDDWKVSLTYSGYPQLDSETEARYKWYSTVVLLIQWYPFSSLQTYTEKDKNGKWSTIKSSS